MKLIVGIFKFKYHKVNHFSVIRIKEISNNNITQLTSNLEL